MAKLVHHVVTFLREEEGLTMVEYAIAGALVAAGCAIAFSNLGTAVFNRIQDLVGWVDGSNTGAGTP